MAVNNFEQDEVVFTKDFIDVSKEFVDSDLAKRIAAINNFHEVAKNGTIEEKSEAMKAIAASAEEIKRIKTEILIRACESSKTVAEIEALMAKLGLNAEDLNRFNDKEVSPLVAFLSVPRTPEEIRNFLAIKGLDPNAVSKNGNTALHLAVQNRVSEDNLKVLLEDKRVQEGINIRNNKGMTALDMAVDGKNNAFAKLLIDKGAQLGVFVVNQEEKEKSPKEQEVSRRRGDLEDKIREFNKKLAEKIEEGDKDRELEAKRRIDAERQIAQARRAAMMAEIRIAQELHEESRAKLLKMKEDDNRAKAELEKSQQIEPVKPVDQNQEQLRELSKLLGKEVTDFNNINLFLHDAAFRGDQNLTMQLIRFGGDVNFTQNGKTVLEVACEGGNRSLVLTLCARNPEVLSGAKDIVKESVNNIVESITRDIKAIDNLLGSLKELSQDLKEGLVALKQEKQEVVEKAGNSKESEIRVLPTKEQVDIKNSSLDSKEFTEQKIEKSEIKNESLQLPKEGKIEVKIDNEQNVKQTLNDELTERGLKPQIQNEEINQPEKSGIDKVFSVPSIDKVIISDRDDGRSNDKYLLAEALKEVGEMLTKDISTKDTDPKVRDDSQIGMRSNGREFESPNTKYSQDDIKARPSTSPKPIEAEKMKGGLSQKSLG